MPDKVRFLYEDNHLLVVEKPVNMLSQGDITGEPDLLSIVKAILKKKYKKPGNVYLGLVHRLDRPTGGVMVLAKTSKAAARLSAQIRAGTFTRQYLAVVHGCLQQVEGTLRHYLVKDRKTNLVAVAGKDQPKAKEASLSYRVLAATDALSLVQIQLHTGRPHQIRVQFAASGHPLYGDQRYGRTVNRPGRQLALWAHKIAFAHPVSKERLSFASYPPRIQPWQKFIAYFNRVGSSNN
ncbi:MAG: RNA pseudouridine synthase [Firmicutes bacterium]|jgi:23S rRNA pseudouridine1911/1915/1917 synthase|nr:RNA pseudouridine synthase [Bacillota bacterium]